MLLRIGTRGSALALVQANLVKRHILAAYPQEEENIAVIPITTSGDRNKKDCLADIGGKGLFTKELEEALLSHHIDMAVHSLKDVPGIEPEGLQLAAFLEREDARDALIGPFARLEDLPPGSTLGTSSPRRAVQIMSRFPSVTIVPMRGNVGTRMEKVARGDASATLLAMAGLNRLGLEKNAVPLSVEHMLPAIGQGAIAVQIREKDTSLYTMLRAINHTPTERAITAERALLKRLNGNCRTPIAGFAELQKDELSLHALLATPDAKILLRASMKGPAQEAERIGQAVAEALLAQGGETIMEAYS